MPTVCIYQRYLPPDPSGAGKQALTLANHLGERGWDVIFLTDSRPEYKKAEENPLRGYTVMCVEPPGLDPSYGQIVRYWTRVARALVDARRKFDVFQVHTADFIHVGATLFARLLRKPVVVRSSMAGEFRNLSASRSGRAQRLALRGAGGFAVLSKELANEYLEAGLPASRLNLVPNGVDTTIYHPVSTDERTTLRRELDLPIDSRIIVYHGVFIDRKSLHWAIEVLEPHMADLDLTLLLVGGPAREEPQTGYAASLCDQVTKSPARDRIIVRSPDPRVHRYLKAADAYVLPSTNEGLSNALLEALATGLVCIASRTSGSADVIDDGMSGLLFDARNAEQFLSRIRAVFGVPALLDPVAMGRSAAEAIRAHYSMAITADRYIGIYEGLIRP